LNAIVKLHHCWRYVVMQQQRLLLALMACGAPAFVVCNAPAFADVSAPSPARQTELLDSADPRLAKNKRLVFDLWRELMDAHHAEAADKYIAEDYIQHNPNIPNGRAAVAHFFGTLPRKDVRPTIRGLVSIVAERDLVVLSFVDEQPDPRDSTKTYTTTWFDMLRVSNGKVVEHWDGARINAPSRRSPE
jgi:predicted SnoaL-like aldol condensation-catalyzing enzyme